MHDVVGVAGQGGKGGKNGKDGTRPAIQAESGTVLIRGCEFHQDRPQVRLGNAVRRAVITDNIFTGAQRIENQAAGNVVINNNVAGKQ